VQEDFLTNGSEMKQKPAFAVKYSQSIEYTVKSIYNKWNLFNTETEKLNPHKNIVKHFKRENMQIKVRIENV
jgi:hypothetical protein